MRPKEARCRHLGRAALPLANKPAAPAQHANFESSAHPLPVRRDASDSLRLSPLPARALSSLVARPLHAHFWPVEFERRRGAPKGWEGLAFAAMSRGLEWESIKWLDGSTYEGLVRDGKCHIRGVMKYSNGDRYEGEFLDNHMHGFGAYVWRNGNVYRGEWRSSRMEGCGVKISKVPGKFIAEEGFFVVDEWAGDVMSCSVEQARAAAAEADIAAEMARHFELDRAVKAPATPVFSSTTLASSGRSQQPGAASARAAGEAGAGAGAGQRRPMEASPSTAGRASGPATGPSGRAAEEDDAAPSPLGGFRLHADFAVIGRVLGGLTARLQGAARRLERSLPGASGAPLQKES